MTSDPTKAPFGSVFGENLPISYYDGESWSDPAVVAIDSVTFGPATHALHYSSECFEGLKGHRQPDGTVKMFRPEKNITRLRNSTERLFLPEPPIELCESLFGLAVEHNTEVTPDPPGSLYLRPTIIGTEHNIGAAGRPSRTAAFYVIASPVGEYLPPHALRIVVETEHPRTTPQFGVVKTGANYAMALGLLLAAKRDWNADQVLFAPGGLIEETGAANFVLIDEGHVVTSALSEAFLHGVTRDSVLQVARSLGWKAEERDVSIDELREWAARPTGEMALAGTAAILGGVGELVLEGEIVTVGTGQTGPTTTMLRSMLTEIQQGLRPFTFD
jgi:branched-chain amino acid aminotransferase